MSTVRIQVRRGTASEWTAANPVLAAGEMGVETNTNLFKFGNGSSTWTSLAYANNSDVAIGEISQDAINTALTMGAGLTKTYNDGANTITITVDTAVVSTKAFATAEAATAQAAAIAAAQAYTDTAVNGVNSSLSGYLEVGDRGVANGVASLDANVKVPQAQLSLGNLTTNVTTSANMNATNMTAENVTSNVLLTANDVTISGNLTVNGTSTTVNSTSVAYDDPMIYIGDGNQSNSLDLGVVAAFNDGTYQHSGLVRDASDNGIWKLFSGVTSEPGTTVDFTTYTKDKLELGTLFADAAHIGDVSNAELQHVSGVLSPIQTQLDAKLESVPDNSVSTVKIALGSVITDRIADGAVTTAKIADGAVTTAKIENASITAAKLANNSVGTSAIDDNAVGTAEIANSAITSAKLALDSVTTGSIADGAVTTAELGALAITAAKIADGAVVLEKLADLAITNAKVSETAEIAQSKISGLTQALDAKAPIDSPTFTGIVTLPANTISQSMMGDDSVGTNEIGGLAVTTAKIADSAVTNEKLAGSIDQSKITSLVSDLAAKASNTALSDHNADTTSVHGITDTSLLVTTTGTETLTNKTLTSPTINGATAGGHIVPALDNTYNLGSPTQMWKDIYVGPGSLYVNGQKVLQDESGAIVVSADINENLGLRTSGSGNIELDPTGTGVVNVKGALVMEAGANISSADGNGLNFANPVKVDSIVSKSLDTDLSLSGNGTGKVYLNDNAEVNGNLIVGGNLTVTGTTVTVNTETISLADNIIDLNSNYTTGTPTENAGMRIIRGDSNAVQMRWNESTDVWEFTNDGTNYSSVLSINDTALTTALNAKLASATAATTYAPIASPTFTGTVTVAAAGVAFADKTQTKAGVPSLTAIGSTLSANTTLDGLGTDAAVRDSLVPLAGAVQINFEATGNAKYAVGSSISFYQASGTGANFIGTGITVLNTPGATLRTTNSSVTATKVAATTWLLAGDLRA